MNKKMDKLLKFMAIGCCTFAIALIIVLQQNNIKIQKHVKSADAMAESYTSTQSNSWDISATENDSVTATLDENGLLTISGTGAMKNWDDNTMPWYSVKGQIKSAKIENGITNIGDYAFWYCDKLTNIEISEGVINIGSGAFGDCFNLTSIEIPSNVTSIGYRAFINCSSIVNIEIPEGLTNIGIVAFNNCSNLTSIKVDENNTTYKDDNGVLYSKDGAKLIKYPEGRKETEYNILNGVIGIESYAFNDSENLVNIEIPNSVTSIGDCAFDNCYNLINIEIPSNVTSIGNEAFYGCENLTIIKISNGITSIGYRTFDRCTSLTSIEIPSSVTSIGNEAFSNCESLASIEVDENNTTYKDDNGVLYSKDGIKVIKYPEGKENEEYTILDGVTNIMDNAFYSCDNLERVKIPGSVTSIGYRAFYFCENLVSIEIPNGVTNIGNEAFYGATVIQLISTESNIIEVPDILKRVQDETDILYTSKEFTFTNCTIEEDMIKIDEGETYAKIRINDGKLYGCTYLISYNSWDISANGDGTITGILDENGLLTISGTGKMKDDPYKPNPWNQIKGLIKSVKIGTGVTGLETRAFSYCENLIKIEVSDSNTEYKDYDGVLYSKDGTELITYPEGKEEKEITILSNVKKIREYAFFNCENLRSIEIPSNVISIENYAFDSCENLTSIKVDEKNTSYKDDNGVLYNKDGTQIIKYPQRKKEREYTILDGVTNIMDEAFYSCKNLMRVEIPSSVTSIGNGAFSNCGNIKNIEIPEGVTKIGKRAFYNLYDLINIEIPSSVTSIDDGAFSSCHSLESILIPSSVTYIGEDIINKHMMGIDNTNAVIVCQKNTTAQTYAENNDIDYISINYDIQKGYIKKIKPETIYENFKNNIKTNTDYLLETENKAIESDSVMTTGQDLTICGMNFKLVITGDTNRDGQAEIKDILAINKHRLNKSKLQAEELLAGDVNGDGKVDIKDIMQINKFRLGKINQL